VKPTRLRSGETLAALAAIALALLLALDWFYLSTPDARVGAHESGIRSLGWFAEVLLVLAILSALALAFFTVANRSPGLPVMFAVLTTFLGAFATIAILVRLLAQPGLGVEAGNADVEIELPAYLGVLAALGITAGGWRTMADERTHTKESLEQTDDVLRVRGGPLPPPPRTIDPA
jgi:drug/metabolite transporter (DMT)-like permease